MISAQITICSGPSRRSANAFVPIRIPLVTKAFDGADTPVEVCYLSPGMVVTDLLVPPPEERGESWEKSKKILNILADTVETVCPFLVDGMLNAQGNGAAVRWLTTGKILRRFALARFNKRDLFGPVGA